MAGIPAICLEGWTPVPSGVNLGIDATTAVPAWVLEARELPGLVQVHLGDGSLGAVRIGDALSREHVSTIARMAEALDPGLTASITRTEVDARNLAHGLPVHLPGRLDLLDPVDQRVLPVDDDGRVTDPGSATGVLMLPEDHLAETLTTANRTDVAPVGSPMSGQLRLAGPDAWIGLPSALVNARHAGLTDARPTGMTGQVNGFIGLLTHLETLQPGQRAVVDVTRTSGVPPETYHVVADPDGLSVLRFAGGAATAQPLPRAAGAMSVTMPGRLGLSAASLATIVAGLPPIVPDDLATCVTGIRSIARYLYGNVRSGRTVDDLATLPSTLTRSGDPLTDPFAEVAEGQWGAFDSLETVRQALRGAPQGTRGATVFALVGRPGAIGHAVAFRNTFDGLQALDFRTGEAGRLRPAEDVAADLADARMLLVGGDGTVTEVATAVESASTVRSVLDSGLPDPATGLRYAGDRKRQHHWSGSGDSKRPPRLIQEVRALLTHYNVLHGTLPRYGRATETVVFRYPRSYANTPEMPLSRVRQSLRHLSTALFEAAHVLRDGAHADGEDYEMQSMLLNDRLVVASNHDTTMDLLDRRLSQIPENPVAVLINDRSRIDRYQGQERIEAQGRLTRAANKIQSSMSSELNSREPNAVTKILRSQGRTVVLDASDRAGVRDVLTSSRYKNAIILLKYRNGAKIHAEQKLMLVVALMDLADIRGDCAIGGRMHECLGCSLLLQYFHQTRRVAHNPESGAAYDDAIEDVLTHFPQVANNPDGSRTNGHWLINRLKEMLEEGYRTTYSAWSNEQPPENAVVGGAPQYSLQSEGPRPHARRNYQTPSTSGSDRSYVAFEPTQRGETRTVRQDLRNDPDAIRLKELSKAYSANRRPNQQPPLEWTEIVGRLYARIGNARAISEYTPGISESTVTKHVKQAERLLQNTGSELTPEVSDALWNELAAALPRRWREGSGRRGVKDITPDMTAILEQMKAWGFSALSISKHRDMTLPPTSFGRYFAKLPEVEAEVPAAVRTDAPTESGFEIAGQAASTSRFIEVDGVTWYYSDNNSNYRYYTYRRYGSNSRADWATDAENARISQFLENYGQADYTADQNSQTGTVPVDVDAQRQFESQLTTSYQWDGYKWYADSRGYYRHSSGRSNRSNRSNRPVQVRATPNQQARIDEIRYPPESSSSAAMAGQYTTMDFGTATDYPPATSSYGNSGSTTGFPSAASGYDSSQQTSPPATGWSYDLPLRTTISDPQATTPRYTRGVNYYVNDAWVVHTYEPDEWLQTYTHPASPGQFFQPILGHPDEYRTSTIGQPVWRTYQVANGNTGYAAHLAAPASATLEPLTGELSTTPLTHGGGFVIGPPGTGLAGVLTELRLPAGALHVVGVGYRDDTGDGVRGGIRNSSIDYATADSIDPEIPPATAQANIVACEVGSTGTLRKLYSLRPEMTVVGPDSEVFVVQGVDGSTEPAKVFTAKTVWVDGTPQLVQTPANQFRAYRPGMSADGEPEAIGYYLPGTLAPTEKEMARAVKVSGAFHALGRGVALHLGPPSPVDQIVRTLTNTVLDDDPKPGLNRAVPLYDDNSVFSRELRALLERQIELGESLANSLKYLSKQGYVKSTLGDRLHVTKHRVELSRAIDHLRGALSNIPGPRTGVAATPVLEQQAFEARNQVIAEAVEDYAITAEEIAKHMRELIADAAVKAAVRGDDSKTKKLLEKTIGLFEGALGWTAGVFLPTGLSFAPALVGLAGKGAGMAALRAFEEYQTTVFQRDNSSTKALLLADLNPRLVAESVAASYQKGFELFLAAAGVGGAYVPGWPVISSGLTKIFTGFFDERLKLLERSIADLKAGPGEAIQEKELYRRLGDRLWSDLRGELKAKLTDLGTVQQIVNAAKGKPELIGLIGIGTDFAVQLGLGLVVTLFPPRPAAKIDGNELRRAIMDVISNRNPADTIVPPTVPGSAPDESIPASVPQTDSHGRQVLAYRASKSTTDAPYVKINVNGTNLWGTLDGTRFTPKEPDTGAFVSMATWKDRVIGPDHYIETVSDPDTGAVTESVRVEGTWHQPWPDFHFLFIHDDGAWEWARAFSPTGRMNTDEFNLKTEFDRHGNWVNKDFSFEAPPALTVNYKPRSTESTQHSWQTRQFIDSFALKAANLSRIHGPRVPLRMNIEGGGNGPNAMSAGIQKLRGVPEQAAASGLARAEEVRKDYVARLDEALDRLRYQHPGQGDRLPKAEDLVAPASSRGSQLNASKLPAGLMKQDPALDDEALHRQTRVWAEDIAVAAPGTPTSAHSSLGSSFHESDLDSRPNWLVDAMQRMPRPQDAPANLIGEGVAPRELSQLAADNPDQVFYWLSTPASQKPTREQLGELNEKLEQFAQGRTQVSVFTKGAVTKELLDVIAPYGGALANSAPQGLENPWHVRAADRTTPRSQLPAQPSSRIDGVMATTMAKLKRNPGIARADEQFGELVWSGLSVREQYDRIKSDPAAYLTRANQDLAAGMAQRVGTSLRAGIVSSLLDFGPETDVVPLVVESPMAERPKTVVSSVYELADAGVQHTVAITAKFQSLVDTIGRSTTDVGERDQLSFTSAVLKAVDQARNGQLTDVKAWAEAHRQGLSPAMKTEFVAALGDVAKDLRTIGRSGDAQDLELVLAAVYEC